MTSMNNISIAVLALVGLPLSPAVAVDELTLSGPYVFALTRDIEGCLKPLVLEPHIAQCRTIPKGTRVNPKEPTRTNFILTCIEDGREPRCLYIPAEILRAAQPRIDGSNPSSSASMPSTPRAVRLRVATARDALARPGEIEDIARVFLAQMLPRPRSALPHTYSHRGESGKGRPRRYSGRRGRHPFLSGRRERASRCARMHRR